MNSSIRLPSVNLTPLDEFGFAALVYQGSGHGQITGRDEKHSAVIILQQGLSQGVDSAAVNQVSNHRDGQPVQLVPGSP